MAFSNKQIQALKRDVKACFVRTRQIGDGRELSYIEGWHAIGEANRIFGHDGWSRETVETKCVLARESKGTFHAVYLAKVRVTVKADSESVVREGCGTGEAMGASAGEVHEKALKTAETDATKRALTTFGKPFGLSLYVSGRNGRDQQRTSRNGHTSDQPIKAVTNHERRRTRQVLSSSGRYYVPPRPTTVLDRELSAVQEASSGQYNTEEPKGQTGSEAPVDQPKSASAQAR